MFGLLLEDLLLVLKTEELFAVLEQGLQELGVLRLVHKFEKLGRDVPIVVVRLFLHELFDKDYRVFEVEGLLELLGSFVLVLISLLGTDSFSGCLLHDVRHNY